MIRINFNRIFKARGIEKPFSYLSQSGFSENFATKVKNNQILRLNSREIEKLCILLRCTPNDFYEWIPENNVQVDSDHPLNSIKRTDKVVNLTKILNSIPLSYLSEIESVIEEKVKNIKQQSGSL